MADKISLRDFYAGAALQGLVPRFDFNTYPSDDLRVAAWAFEVADAMIKMREASPTEQRALFEARIAEWRTANK